MGLPAEGGDDGTRRYKARLVMKGFQRREGINFNEIFSPVMKLTIITSMLSIMVAKDLHLEELDVRTPFLHGNLEEEFTCRSHESISCLGRKSLYG